MNHLLLMYLAGVATPLLAAAILLAYFTLRDRFRSPVDEKAIEYLRPPRGSY